MQITLTHSHCSTDDFDFLWFQHFPLKALKYIKMDITYLHSSDWHYSSLVLCKLH